MDNPWERIPASGDFVLAEDLELVLAFNEAIENDSRKDNLSAERKKDILDRKLDVTLPPNPFAGFHDAPLVVLLANLGLHDGDVIQKEPQNATKLLHCIQKPGGSPVIWLTNEGSYLSKNNWWINRTTELAEFAGGSEELARKMLVVELHGYHSVKWSPPMRNFPSQEYSFSLVESAIERDVPIILAKCARHWLASVPKLRNHEKLLNLSSTRQAALSSNNILDRNGSKEKGFALVKEALKK